MADTTPAPSSSAVDVAPVRDAVDGLLPRALDDLRTLVAIPSVADERLFPHEECVRAAQWVADAFRAEGIDDARLEPTPDGSDVVVGYRPGPQGAPTVLLYAHYDVQPPLDDAAWTTPPFELTERDGRLYGRGAADCKGNIVAHLTALRALRALRSAGGDDGFPVGVRVLIEGSEEQGTGGLEQYVEQHPGELGADAILIADTGNAALGVPTLTVTLRGIANVVVSVEALAGEIHSGMFGGAAPDALAALVVLLATLRDADGNTTVDGLDTTQVWDGVAYDEDQFRTDAGVVDGVGLLGSGSVADQLWARPALTILGIDAPKVVGSSAAIQPRAAARLNLRVPPGTDPDDALEKLTAHLHAHAPWGARVTVEPEGTGQPFRARTSGHVFDTLAQALADAFGAAETTTAGQGGSIPLCNVLQDGYPDAEVVLLGVEEPACLIHAPNESVDPGEIARLAVAEALFLTRLGATPAA
ncbi:dipeptidase [Luteimicrobium subarcticum]|uniref:Acetylornithine deacetylase/succinyl-diaminopimelate desuccinylase-like protein n=1 Tax=Luteimicrobium subarcticum TaxID=620910 RepID=A0A2M8WQP9_9MICO|nr:dipeptidase [Luteimicrobium subarcticum]PJI93271.1 acetylornithine deacetylase/succinyl-diaminopimelate desuccinylase-like protein [Luteimicrobium subarcticum]